MPEERARGAGGPERAVPGRGQHGEAGTLSVAVEDYLKAVHELETQHGGPVNTTDLARTLGISPGSVSAMIQRLAGRGVLLHQRYYGVSLTVSGRRIALSILRQHRLVELHLMTQLGMTDEHAHDEAEVLEHHISPEFRSRLIADLLGRLEDGASPAVPLSRLAPGQHGLVVGTSAATGARPVSIAPGEYVQMVGQPTSTGAIHLHTTLGSRMIAAGAAPQIQVIPG